MANEEDYKGQHAAPDAESGVPMHDMTGSGMMPSDFYKSMHQYALSGEPTEQEAMGHISRVKGKPSAGVRIYRAIPKSMPRGTKINPGDWVTPVRGYATEHGRSNLSNQFRIVEGMARARHLFNEGNDLHEWGWHPSDS